MSRGVPRRRKRRTRRWGAWGDGPVPPPLSSHLRSARSFGGYPNWCPSLGCSSCGAQGALSPPPPVSGPAGWPATQPPFTWGVVHLRGGGSLLVGSHSVVPRCGAGGAPRLVGSHIAWGTTPRLASSDLALRTAWSSRSRRRALLTVSLVLTVSLRRTPRSHGYLTNHGGAPPGEGPFAPQKRGPASAPPTLRAQSLLGPYPSVHRAPALTGVAHVVSPVWSTPGVGAPCRRASTARHQDPGWTQPETHHRVSLTLQGVGDPAPVAHHS